MTRALRAEWTKLRTVPSTGWTVLALVAGTVVVGAVALAGARQDEDLVRLSLSGVYLGQTVAVVLAVLAVSPEYDTGMIRTTLAAEPVRARVLAAKLAVVTVIVLLTGTAAVLGSRVAAWIMLSDKGLPVASLGDGAVLRAHLGTILYFGLIGPLAVGTALIVRHTGATITVLLSLLYTFPIIAALVTDPSWQRWILRVAPMSAGLAIQATADLDALPIAPWPGLGVLTAYAVAALVVGGVSFRTRDAD